jgi:hypothetical protein
LLHFNSLVLFGQNSKTFHIIFCRSSRLNMDVAAIPGMNPPAPEPVAAGTAGADGSGPAAPGGTPDYAALLQYLQYYQKQMGTEEEGN